MKVRAFAFWLAALLAAQPALADGDAAAGEKVFKVCYPCHAIGPGAQPKVGNVLNDVVGRQAGTGADFPYYSDAMTQAGAAGLVWTPANLTKYLTDPRAMVPGAKMAFAGLKRPADIKNVIAYLETYSPNYQPVAAPPAPPPAQ